MRFLLAVVVGMSLFAGAPARAETHRDLRRFTQFAITAYDEKEKDLPYAERSAPRGFDSIGFSPNAVVDRSRNERREKKRRQNETH